MNIQGHLSQILPEQGGTGKTGNAWRKRSFIIETMDTQYPKKVCFDVWGDTIDQLTNLQLGTEIDVSFDIESREFNGKWYTNAKAWKFDVATAQTPPQQAAQPNTPAAQASQSTEPTDDLPF